MEGREESIDVLLDLLEQELTFTFSRSSGPGGQHANKASTRVELRFAVNESLILSDGQKQSILKGLGSRISDDGILILSAQDERSQLRNRDIAISRFRELVARALRPRKRRIPTKPPAGLNEKRLTEKKKTSNKKESRKKPEDKDL